MAEKRSRNMMRAKAHSRIKGLKLPGLCLVSIPFAIAFLTLASCTNNDTIERYIDMKLPDSLYVAADLGDSVHLEWDSTRTRRVQLLIWRGEQLDSNQLKRLPTPEHYDGGFALLSLTIFAQDSIEKKFTLRYNGDGKGLKISQSFNRVKVPPPIEPTKSPFVTLLTIKDANFDPPPWGSTDKGMSPIIGLDPTWYPQYDAFAFAFENVRQNELKTATLRVLTYAWPYAWASDSVTLQVRIRAINAPWTEGTGNWYWHDGNYKNGGDTILKHYGIDVAHRTLSTNPALTELVNMKDTTLFNSYRLIPVAEISLRTRYENSEAKVLPPPDALVPLEIDITDYMKSGDLTRNYGFFIQVDGMPALSSYSVVSPSKELMNGTLAPKIILEY